LVRQPGKQLILSTAAAVDVLLKKTLSHSL
jgi:hypothetical protein